MSRASTESTTRTDQGDWWWFGVLACRWFLRCTLLRFWLPGVRRRAVNARRRGPFRGQRLGLSQCRRGSRRSRPPLLTEGWRRLADGRPCLSRVQQRLVATWERQAPAGRNRALERVCAWRRVLVQTGVLGPTKVKLQRRKVSITQRLRRKESRPIRPGESASVMVAACKLALACLPSTSVRATGSRRSCVQDWEPLPTPETRNGCFLCSSPGFLPLMLDSNATPAARLRPHKFPAGPGSIRRARQPPGNMVPAWSDGVHDRRRTTLKHCGGLYVRHTAIEVPSCLRRHLHRRKERRGVGRRVVQTWRCRQTEIDGVRRRLEGHGALRSKSGSSLELAGDPQKLSPKATDKCPPRG